MHRLSRLFFMLLALTTAVPAVAKSAAPSVRLEIKSRVPAFNGRSFGDRGTYETISGVAHMRIDPRAAANRGIVDLALAPRSADGMVDYDIDFVIQRPADRAKAQRVLVYEVVNRGMRLMPMMMGSGMNPADAGDGLLQNQGFTLVASGWQGDIASPSLLGARFPVATSNGNFVTGLVSTETIFDSPSGEGGKGRIALPYTPTVLEQPEAMLTVQSLPGSPAIEVPVTDWRFIDERTVELNRPEKMDAGAIYRFTYAARGPRVMGLGFAATRDFIAWLRYASTAQGNPLGDIGAPPCEFYPRKACALRNRAIFTSAVAFGASQSGRYLRDFLWQGFNRDLAGRKVFDGVIPFIAGARQTFTNFRFAEPGRFSRQHEDHSVPGFTFPFTYATLRDPVTGRTDGILRSCENSGTCPKLFHIDTSAEFWQAGASLVGTGGTAHDVDFPANVRAYMITGGAHAPGMVLPSCRYPTNRLNYAPVVRALMMAMIDWSLVKTNPPESRWPSLDKSELVPVSALNAPRSASLPWAQVMNRPVPPAGKADWPVFAPAIDADGNDAPGIRLPQIASPDGTYLGWNLRKPGYGEGDLCLLAGSFLPFAKDAASRGDDPRPSLAERYPDGGVRARRVIDAVNSLSRDRLLLKHDADAMLRD